jgi:hypothetical protein
MVAGTGGVAKNSLTLHDGHAKPSVIAAQHQASFVGTLKGIYDRTLTAGDFAADVLVHSRSPLAPLAAIPGVLATAWTHDTAAKLSQGISPINPSGSEGCSILGRRFRKLKAPAGTTGDNSRIVCCALDARNSAINGITLGTATYGFGGLPKTLTHFTTSAGTAGIAEGGQ